MIKNKPLLICFLFYVALLGYSCKKNSPEATDDVAKPGVTEKDFYTLLKVDSIKQRSFVVNYRLNKEAESTGVINALDSMELVANAANYTPTKATLLNNTYTVKIAYPYNSPPENKIWYRIYSTDKNGVKSYSPVISQQIAIYELKNKYVVNGKAEFNNHPKDFFINYEGGDLGAQDNALNIEAIISDMDIQNYRATINDAQVNIGKIDALSYPFTHKTILIDVPDDLPTGPASFKLYYKSKLVYSETIQIINGGLLSKSKHPVNYFTGGTFFTAGDKLYTFSSDGSAASSINFHSWTPATNEWKKLPNPTELPKLNMAANLAGKLVNGIVYFAPVYIRPWGIYDKNNPYYYQEVMMTYNPATNEWKKIMLVDTKNEAEDRSLYVTDFFEFNNKLYCITSEAAPGYSGANGANNIRVYDPASKSWELFMKFPFSTWSCRSVINNGRVYLLTSKTGKQEAATTNFVNEFYELNMDSKTLVAKSWINDKSAAVMSPYMMSFKDKIYVYGGQYSSGYTSLYSSLFTVYDPNSNQWAPVSGYSYYTAWVSQTLGFLTEINGKAYVGLGYDRYTNGNIYGSKISASVYQVSLK